MLIWLKERNKIINTDFIVRIDEIPKVEDKYLDSLINLKPDETIPTEKINGKEKCCRITMSNGEDIDIETDILSMWKYINVN